MSVWCCIGYSTEEQGENKIRHRVYTQSEITAEAWRRIPRIDFTDSGHGIAFTSYAHNGKRKLEKLDLYRHVDEHLPRLRAAVKQERRAQRRAA